MQFMKNSVNDYQIITLGNKKKERERERERGEIVIISVSLCVDEYIKCVVYI